MPAARATDLRCLSAFPVAGRPEAGRPAYLPLVQWLDLVPQNVQKVQHVPIKAKELICCLTCVPGFSTKIYTCCYSEFTRLPRILHVELKSRTTRICRPRLFRKTTSEAHNPGRLRVRVRFSWMARPDFARCEPPSRKTFARLRREGSRRRGLRYGPFGAFAG